MPDFLFVMTETEVIKGCIQENRRCQNELYKRYFHMMSGIAIRYTSDKDEAIHKLNYGFLKVLQNIHKYNSQFTLATFIRNILIRHLIDEFRKEKKYSANISLTEEHELEAGFSFNQGEAKMEAKELLQMLNQLPEVTKNVFNLFAIDGYKHTEISELLGMSVGTSKWHVSDARKKLQDLVNKTQEKRYVKKAN